MKPVLIFDLDGTLADSQRDLTQAVNSVRQRFDLPALADNQISDLIGDGAPMLVRRALGELASESNLQDALQWFLSYYRLHMLDNTVLYPGVKETLERFSDCSLAVLTNKPVRFSCVMLEGLGIYRYFSAVYGGNSFDRKKPDPIGIYRILADTNGLRENAWMIGDSAVDILTGRNAAVKTCGVNYGYAAKTFAEQPPDYRIDFFAELEALVHA